MIAERSWLSGTEHKIVFEVEVAKKAHEHGNLVKTKMETVPFSRASKTTE